MAKLLDYVIVVDVESTCWKLPNGMAPEGQTSDIIEIGICTLDVPLLVCDRLKSIIVKPTRSTVSAFCTQLTSLTQDMVDEGTTLAQACDEIEREYGANGRGWASWGDYDRKQFAGNCRDLSIRFPFGPTHTNVKSLYALMAGLGREISLVEAVRQLGLTFEGTPHRGVDDAGMIAAVLSELLERGRK